MSFSNDKNAVIAIALLGRTNAGKSTLLNSLTRQKLAATTAKVNTTRKPLTGFWQTNKSTFLLLDAPGTCQTKTNLDRLLFSNILSVIEISDCVCWLVDVHDAWGKDNQILANLLKSYSKPIFLIINKIDLITKDQLLARIAFFQKQFAFQAIVPLSAKKGLNFTNLAKLLHEHFLSPQQKIKLNSLSTKTLLQTTQEIVREQLIQQTQEEIPHQTTLIIDNWGSTPQRVHFDIIIFVATNSQKAIVLGEKGHKIKQIRLLSQKMLNHIYQKPVLLFLKVKVHKKWYQDLHFLNKLDLLWKTPLLPDHDLK